ncbi:MAG: ExbD/TolR family protein [Bacteriovoracia bacterium]
MAFGGLSPRPGDADLGDDDAPIMAEINITPLTDIFLVLLIIFMVTSSVMSQTGVDVDLPKASEATSAAQPEGTIVTLLADGGLLVNGQRVPSAGGAVDWAAFRADLKRAFSGAKSRSVILEGDRKAFLGAAVELMDEARQAGAEGFAIATAAGK